MATDALSDLRAQKERERLAARSRRLHAEASDVGAIPPPKNPIIAAGLGWTKRRRDACELDLHAFLVHYFPNGTGQRPFGDKQIEAIKHLEHCILHSGRRLNLLPRGYCKSSISEGACLWATLYGHRRFVLFLAANEDEATTGIESIQRELSDNPLLAEDFPEVVSPISRLEGKSQRCSSQTHDGKLTHIEWTSRRIVLPEIEGSKASGAIISADGLLAASRGARHKRSDGSTARPDFVVIDDPQTDTSAISPSETAKRLRILRKSVLRLGGHGKQVSAVCNATMIAAGDFVDQLSDRKKYPGWVTVRTPTVITMPKALETHWLKKYADLLRSFDENDIDGQRIALDKATAYYVAHRTEMDDGASVAWDDVPLEEGEISALQHALNILIIDGQDVFDSECQNAPGKQDVASHLQITQRLSERLSGFKRGQVPEGAAFHVFMVDVQDHCFYWSRACVAQDFSGSVVDYGVWPEQPVSYFSYSGIKRKLTDQYSGETVENAMRRGLVDLLKKKLAEYPMPIDVGLIDAGYKPDLVANAIRLSGLSNVYTSHGIGIGPVNKPMPEYDMSSKLVVRCGPDTSRPRWYFPRNIAERVHFDANFWKDFAATRLTQDESISGAWKLFGNAQSANHDLYIDQLCSEHPEAVSAKGRTVNCWKVIASRDNHYWDTFVGCIVAASIAGAQLPGMEAPKRKVVRRRRYGGSSPLNC